MELFTFATQVDPQNGEATDVLQISFSDDFNDLSYTSKIVFRDVIADGIDYVSALPDLTFLEKVSFDDQEYFEVIYSENDRWGNHFYFSYEIGIIAFRDHPALFGTWMKSSNNGNQNAITFRTAGGYFYTIVAWRAS